MDEENEQKTKELLGLSERVNVSEAIIVVMQKYTDVETTRCSINATAHRQSMRPLLPDCRQYGLPTPDQPASSMWVYELHMTL